MVRKPFKNELLQVFRDSCLAHLNHSFLNSVMVVLQIEDHSANDVKLLLKDIYNMLHLASIVNCISSVKQLSYQNLHHVNCLGDLYLVLQVLQWAYKIFKIKVLCVVLLKQVLNCLNNLDGQRVFCLNHVPEQRQPELLVLDLIIVYLYLLLNLLYSLKWIGFFFFFLFVHQSEFGVVSVWLSQGAGSVQSGLGELFDEFDGDFVVFPLWNSFYFLEQEI